MNSEPPWPLPPSMRRIVQLLALFPTCQSCDCSWARNGANCGASDGSACWITCCGSGGAHGGAAAANSLRTKVQTVGITFEGKGGKLLANGKEYKLKGVNWWGMEHGQQHAPYGLDVHSVDWYMTFLVENGFNAVRFFFTHESVFDSWNKVKLHQPGFGPDRTDYHHVDHAKYLVGLTSLQMMKRLTEDMAKHGILVMLACHRIRPTLYPGAVGSGLWYEYNAVRGENFTVWKVKESWTKLSEALCGQWNVRTSPRVTPCCPPSLWSLTWHAHAHTGIRGRPAE